MLELATMAGRRRGPLGAAGTKGHTSRGGREELLGAARHKAKLRSGAARGRPQAHLKPLGTAGACPVPAQAIVFVPLR